MKSRRGGSAGQYGRGSPYNWPMAATDLCRIAQAYGIRLVLQFGSTVTGRVHPASDVDLGVLLERPSLTLEERSELLHELQRLFPDREVDLAILNHADPLFLKKVTEDKRYQDHRKYFDLERRFVAKALAGPAARG